MYIAKTKKPTLAPFHSAHQDQSVQSLDQEQHLTRARKLYPLLARVYSAEIYQIIDPIGIAKLFLWSEFSTLKARRPYLLPCKSNQRMIACLKIEFFDGVVSEYEVDIAALLECCFDGIHEGSTYFKQAPHGRFIAWDNSKLIGHIGFDFRMKRVGNNVLPILGVIDLCVRAENRRLGVGRALLERAEIYEKGKSFSLAMADDRRLYEQTGYSLLPHSNTTCLAIDELKSHSVIERDLSEIFLVKRLSDKQWPEGKIDLLGYLF